MADPAASVRGSWNVAVPAESAADWVIAPVSVTVPVGTTAPRCGIVTVKSGKGTVTIPKLKKGTWKISAKYAGTANFAKTATKKIGTVKVTK